MRARAATIAAPIATAMLAIGTAAWAAKADLPFVAADRAGALAVSAQATGPLVANDHDGSAILSAGALAPGQTTTGEATIRNAGDAAGAFTLSPSVAADTGGSPAGPLSGVLELAVLDVSGTSPVTMFAGKLAALLRVPLGMFAAGDAHRYRFELTYPAGVPADVDNGYQGASASVRFDWDAAAVGGGATTAAPTAPPAGTVSGPPPGSGAAAPSPSSASTTATSPAAAAAIPASTATGALRLAVGTATKGPVQNGRLVTWMSSSAASRARVTGTVSWKGHRTVLLRPATVELTAKRRTVRLRLPAAAVGGATHRLTVRVAVTAVSAGRTATIRRTLRVMSR